MKTLKVTHLNPLLSSDSLENFRRFFYDLENALR